MTVEWPGAQKLKRILQRIYIYHTLTLTDDISQSISQSIYHRVYHRGSYPSNVV